MICIFIFADMSPMSTAVMLLGCSFDISQLAAGSLQIQRMVISGGSFSPDILKPKEVVSLLLDDDEMERKCEHCTLLYRIVVLGAAEINNVLIN